jgi:mannose-6-phosphate isomerase-like protein (cupin superfamily)
MEEGSMTDYVIKRLEDAPDVLGDYPGEMRMMTYELGAEKAAFTWRRMPPQTGGKGSYGHRHKEAEEIYFVAEGTLQFKLEDDVIDVEAGNVVLVPPQVARSVWNDSDADAVVIIVSNRVEDPRTDAETVPDFWPDE